MPVPSPSAGKAIVIAALLALAPGVSLAAPVYRLSVADSMPMTARIKRISLTNISGAPHHQLLLQTVAFDPGAAVPPHVHPGDKTVRIEDGDLTFVIGNDPPRTFHRGDMVRIPAGVTNAAYNLTDGSARVLEIIVVEKGQPLSTRVNARPSQSAPRYAPPQYTLQPAPSSRGPLDGAYSSNGDYPPSGGYHPARDPDEGNFVREYER